MPTTKAKKTSNTKPAPKKQSKKTVKAVVETPPVETVDVAPTPVETTTVDTSVNSVGNNVKVAPQLLEYDEELVVLQNQLKEALNLVKTAMTGLSTLQKKVVREKRVVDRKMKGKVKKEKDPNAPPTGFEKPVNVSVELGAFLGVKKGEKISRANVTSKVSAYCKGSGLQKKTDGRYIFPDEKLSALLKIDQGKEITFFDIQKHLKFHYPDSVAKAAAAAAATTTTK